MGYARILIPQSLVTKSFNSPSGADTPTEDELAYMRRGLSVLGPMTVDGVIEAATLDLTPADLANLETGDIVVLENHNVSLDGAGCDGFRQYTNWIFRQWLLARSFDKSWRPSADLSCNRYLFSMNQLRRRCPMSK